MFFNAGEFAGRNDGDAHTWDGENVLAILDNEKLESKYSAEYLLETNLSLLVKIPTSAITRPKEREVHVFDGIRYTIWSVSADMGVYEIELAIGVL